MAPRWSRSSPGRSAAPSAGRTSRRCFIALGAEVSEREGSRVGVFLFGQVRVFHRPHPTPETDKGAVASIRKWLEENGVTP
ncbi:MAG: type II toxin-antitoxin system HicA family toxin [Rhizobium sp.]|nr:type II toxin-antitoxin system HicA family toxin [Rhizobium sp.]